MHRWRDAGRRRPRLPGGAFARGVVTLASGTAAAQLLTVLALPLITRLYSPADYGALAVYSSTLTVLLVVASLRYEVAIPLPETEDVARGLLALALLLLAATTVLIALLVRVAGQTYVSAVKVPALAPYLWLIPLGFAGGGTYQALSRWALRRRAFGPIARTKLSQGVGQVAAQAGLGLAGLGAPGLLVGDVVGRVAGAGSLALLALRERSAGGSRPGTALGRGRAPHEQAWGAGRPAPGPRAGDARRRPLPPAADPPRSRPHPRPLGPPHGDAGHVRERGEQDPLEPSVDLGSGLHEGISVALMEAMAHGVPVVATRSGGLPELLGGGAGLQVEPGDAGALADALERVIRSPALREQLALAGRRRIERDFDVRVIAHELERRFAGLAGGAS